MTRPVELPLTGGCNCGAVRYEVSEPLVRASYCHCTRCQRRTGTAASAQAHPAPGTFRIVAGHEALRVWKPSDGGEKWFCGERAVVAQQVHLERLLLLRAGQGLDKGKKGGM